MILQVSEFTSGSLTIKGKIIIIVRVLETSVKASINWEYLIWQMDVYSLKLIVAKWSTPLCSSKYIT